MNVFCSNDNNSDHSMTHQLLAAAKKVSDISQLFGHKGIFFSPLCLYLIDFFPFFAEMGKKAKRWRWRNNVKPETDRGKAKRGRWESLQQVEDEGKKKSSSRPICQTSNFVLAREMMRIIYEKRNSRFGGAKFSFFFGSNTHTRTFFFFFQRCAKEVNGACYFL